MKKFNFSRLFAAAVIAAGLVLSGCTPSTGDNGNQTTININNGNGTSTSGNPAGGQTNGQQDGGNNGGNQGGQSNGENQNGGNQGGNQNGGNQGGSQGGNQNGGNQGGSQGGNQNGGNQGGSQGGNTSGQTTTLPTGVSALTSTTNVVGVWASSGEKFETQTNYFKNYYYNNTTNAWVETYTGDNLCVKYTNEAHTEGYIYMKYTKAMMPDYSYSTTAPDVGKWYAIAFKDLNTSATPNTIKLAGAYKAGGQTSTTTLEAAITEFTVGNGYYGYYSDLAKQ